ncbi:hypothetical protein STTU_2095 [Streptomyces sp. Tu6071]|nr:hypothetical protein STTU_2095 [Streptomyces sp. Tu6071]
MGAGYVRPQVPVRAPEEGRGTVKRKSGWYCTVDFDPWSPTSSSRSLVRDG